MLLTTLITCGGSLQAQLKLVGSQLRKSVCRLVVDMNGYLRNDFQFHLRPTGLAGNVIPGISTSQGQPGFYPGVVPFLLPQPQLASHSLALVEKQFIQNFAFVNSEHYHQNPDNFQDSPYKGKNSRERESKEVILNKLNAQKGDSSSVSSREASPTRHWHQEFQASQTSQEDMCEARGVKRHLDPRHSPQKKRSRGPGVDTGFGYHAHCQSVRAREMDELSQIIWQHYEENSQSQDIYLRKMRLREALYALMKGVFPYCGVYVVGSSMNGFGAQTSDMDMCIMLSQAEIDQKKEATEILRIILKSLRTCSFLREINLIRAKVPILKFQDRISKVEVDLNINNSVGIRNTHLLYAYSKMDWRVGALVLFVKHWAKIQQINDASQGTISSYSLVLMVIHYLQTSENGQPAVLPSLQVMYPTKFNPNVDVRLLTLNEKMPTYTSANRKTLGELFSGFLRYYGQVFDFQEDVISVRLGKKFKKSEVLRQSKMPSQWKYICIEEPFDMSNTARSVYDIHVFQRIYRVMRVSHQRLQQSGNVYRIIKQPL